METKDLTVFLNFHQKYKQTLKKHMERESDRFGSSMLGLRAGSYYVRDPASNTEDSMLDYQQHHISSEKSFKVNMTTFIMQDNYMYPSKNSSMIDVTQYNKSDKSSYSDRNNINPEDKIRYSPRPQFRIQMKKWQQSNFGDFIEFQVVIQSLEAERPIWTLFKRYTDFVKLHDSLLPFFKNNIAKEKSLWKDSTAALPMLPGKIQDQSELQLSTRMTDLEQYMSQVLSLMKGSSQFNSDFLEFLEFIPTSMVKNEEVKEEDEDIEYHQHFSPVYFEAEKYVFNTNKVLIKPKNHQVRLDPQQKPKTYYVFTVDFEGTGAKIQLEKLFGEFKKLNRFITTTFENEIKEYERIEALTAQG